MGLSGGQKRRLDIALGLIHSPELLFLDEPSTGLDPQSRANLWQHILELRREHGTTIFVTTHFLEEADLFAERVLVMDHGRMIADDTAAALKTRLAGDVITLGFASARDAAAAAPAIEKLDGPPTPPTAQRSRSRSTAATASSRRCCANWTPSPRPPCGSRPSTMSSWPSPDEACARTQRPLRRFLRLSKGSKGQTPPRPRTPRKR